MSPRRAIVAGLVAAASTAAASPPAAFPPTPAPDGGGVPGQVWRAMAAGFDRASAEREPPPRPPVPVPVTWKARRVASLDLGAPLLAMTAGDLDGDGLAELVALTERHVVVLRPAGRGLGEVARTALPAAPAPMRPRDAVGAVAIAARPGGGGDVLARASTAGQGARYRLDGKVLREVGAHDGFPLCAGASDELVPGRNYFGPAPAPLFSRRCREDLIDAHGRAMRVEATVAVGGRLTVVLETRCKPGEAACLARREVVRDTVGVAIEVDDVDRDGVPEVIISGAGAPGDADAVAVLTVGATGFPKKPVFRRAFSGGVAALCSGDVDGDGDRDVFAAVRLAGARKVDLWLLD